MTAFSLLATLMLAGAVLCVAWPLLKIPGTDDAPADRARRFAPYRDELDRSEADVRAGVLSKEEHDAARCELEDRLFDDLGSSSVPACDAAADDPRGRRADVRARIAACALLVTLMPGAAFALYLRLGEPAALTLDREPADPHAAMAASPELMVARLATRLAAHPGDAGGWAMLARSYFVLGRPADAAAAYARAVALTPHDAQLRADYADAIASANNGSLAGEAGRQIDAALALDPANPKALALAGSAAEDVRDYRGAIGYWERLEASLEPGSEAAAQARRNVDQARSLLARDAVRDPKAAQ
jgi:cytochrome c-type biogenesis protein CcmH